MRLRFDDPVAVDHPLYERYAIVAAGTAGRCPECGDTGVIDSVERATHVQNQRCSGCGYRWQYRFESDGRIAEMRELAGRRLDLLAPPPEDVGSVLDLRDDRAGAHVAHSAGRGWWRR